MPELSKETAALLGFLLPGLLAAWVFYGLTSHIKPSNFERTVQALIFTFLVQIALPIAKYFLESVGKYYSIRVWDDTADTITSALLAVGLGAVLACATNKDFFHGLLRKTGLTTRASHPSEWHGAFSSQRKNLVVLHLEDERRLSGFPLVWPSEPGKGHFHIIWPAWLNEAGEHCLSNAEGILINSKDVKWVEFIEKPKGAENHGAETARTATESTPEASGT